jgi:hypothetical protein
MRQPRLISEAYEPAADRCAFPVWSDSDGRLMYPCPDELWQEHSKRWRQLRRNGQTGIVEPFPAGHCMFESPRSYGIYRYGETRQNVIRRAHRRYVQRTMDGWDRELREAGKPGLRRLAKIISATVDARMGKVDVGGQPFVAVLMAGIDI